MTNRLQVPDFSGLSVAVVGDAVCDRYVVCEPRSLSREAPVMVLRHRGERFGAGGAANVARNLRSLGAKTRILGTIGRDASGRELLQALDAEGIDTSALQSLPDWDTPTKTRIVAAEARRSLSQVLRIDREPAHPVPEAARARVARDLAALAGEVDALVVSDYEYGLIGSEVAAAAMTLDRGGIPVVLDPRSSLAGFEGVCALSPNVGELASFTGRRADRLGQGRELAAAAAELCEKINARRLLVTRGNLGMALFEQGSAPDGLSVEASGTGEVTDVSGAGDTAAAVFALALAAGCEGPRAMELANAASGVVVMESGTAVCTPLQLRDAMANAPVPVRLAEVTP